MVIKKKKKAKAKKSEPEKVKSIYKICNGMQKRNGMSDEKKRNCIVGIARRWKVNVKK